MRELSSVLHDVKDGAERIRKIVRGLRALAREDAVATPANVHAAIDVSTNMAMHELRQRASLELDLAPVPLVLADEARLSQVLVNLLVNAAQAFAISDPTRNRVHIKTSTTSAGSVLIEVSDNGPGIPEDLLTRVFDPFFTTKTASQGTGLGLSISQIIVTALGGELTCENVRGSGATFRVILPAAKLADSIPAPGSSRPAARQGRVMVVDDEQPILRAVARVLGGEHEVVCHDDAREARQVLRDTGASFDVVFCDLMMPNMTGIDLYRAILEGDAVLADRFVFMTGGAATEEVRAFLSEVANERIEKPFSNQNLRGIARRLATVGQVQRASDRPGRG
jgi:CheY-like chemotaxis protein/two-component sensor histidine kinase